MGQFDLISRFVIQFPLFVFFSLPHLCLFIRILSVLSHGEVVIEYGNATIESLSMIEQKERVSKLCGAQFCPDKVTADVNPNLTLPDDDKIQLLMCIFLAMMVVASLLIAFGVDRLKRYEMGRKGSGSELSGIRLLSVTVKQLMQSKQILLLPITMFIGVEQAFMAVDFTSVRGNFYSSHKIDSMFCSYETAENLKICFCKIKNQKEFPKHFAILNDEKN